MSDGGWISVDRSAAPASVVIAPTGDVDMSRSAELRTAIQGVFQPKGTRKLVIDLDGVGYMDSSGLATLVEAMRTSKTAGATMVLCGMNTKVRAIFEIARLDQFFTIVDDRAAALSR